MNKVLLIAIGFVLVAMGGFVVFAISNRDSGTVPAAVPVATIEAPEAPAVPPANTAEATANGAEMSTGAAPTSAVLPPPVEPISGPAPVEDTTARAAFEVWAEPLRAAGLEVSADSVGYADTDLIISGLGIGGPWLGLQWRWLSGTARIGAAQSTAFTLEASGPQTLSLAQGDTVTAWSGPVETIQLRVMASTTRPFTTLVASVVGLSLKVEDGARVALAKGDFRINIGTGTIPASPVKLTDLILPLWTAAPFGVAISTLDADVGFSTAGGEGLSVNKLNLVWGALQLTGAGRIGVDEDLRPAGSFSVKIPDVLAALDAIHVLRRSEPTMLADTYAALLRAMVAQAAPDYTIAVGNGAMNLLGAEHGIDDIRLTDVLPLVGPAPGQ